MTTQRQDWEDYQARCRELDEQIDSGKTITDILRERQLAVGRARIAEIMAQNESEA